MSKITDKAHQTFSWFFKDKSGKVIILQWPNQSFALWLSLKIFLNIFPAYHHTLLSQFSSTVLIYWSLLETIKGDSNFRKLLGASVFTITTIGLIKTLAK